MEIVLLVLIVVGFFVITVANAKPKTKRRLPPKFRQNQRPTLQSPPKKRFRPMQDWTTPAGRSRSNAGKRVTSGIEHDPPPPIPESRRLIGRAWVIDGDTIRINQIKIRLAGIDAPELDEPWGRKSKWAMVNICKGKTVHVELSGETSYDRLVGTCYLPDGTDIGAELVKEGLALDGSYFSKGKYLNLEPEGVRQRLGRYGLKQRWK